MVGEKVVDRVRAIPTNTIANVETLLNKGVVDTLIDGNRRMKTANKALTRGR